MLNSIILNIGVRFILIIGIVGIGKIFLVYDIVKEVMFMYEVKVVYCGNLNGGYEMFKCFYWDIELIKWFNLNIIM